MDESQRQYHEVANIFPLIEGEAFETLKSDIFQHGLREAIWLHPDESIIDGRNRHRACIELGITPELRYWDEEKHGPLLPFVISLNLHRRHLNETQRAMVAAKVANMRQGERTDLEPSVNLPKVSQSQAAELLNVSEKTVRFAVTVQENAAPELLSLVESGEVAVSAAAEVASLPAEEQKDLVAKGKKAITTAAKQVKKRKKYAARQKKQEAQRQVEHRQVQDRTRCSLLVGKADNLYNNIDPEFVDIIITSPPYNLGDDNWPMGGGDRMSRNGIEYQDHSDTMTQEEYEDWQLKVFQCLYWVASEGASFFYNHKCRTVGGKLIHPWSWVGDSRNPWTVRQEIIWNRKSTHNHSERLFWPIDERIYWMTKGEPNLVHPVGLPTVWEEFGPVPNTWHPAPFTIELPRMLLKAVGANASHIVLDPFAGSCTTLRAALEFGCTALGVDVSFEYLQKAVEENGWQYEILHADPEGIAVS